MSLAFSYAEPPAQSSDVTASLTATRITGPAPLGVFFDATGTAYTGGDSVDEFKDLGYYFEYGETGLGDWDHVGYAGSAGSANKNIDRGGPLGAHVYETPGTYTAKVRAYYDAENYDDAEVEITVTDPDAVYAGTDTICLSMNSDFTGAPSGASQQGSLSSWPTFESDKRYLLHAGQDFSSLGTLGFEAGDNSGIVDSQLGIFGTGANPIVSAIYTAWNQTDPIDGVNSRCAIYDLDFGSTTQTTQSFDMLWLRCGWGSVFWLNDPYGYYIGQADPTPQWLAPGSTIIQECHGEDGSNAAAIYGQSNKLAIMGTEILNASGRNQHNVRITSTYKCVIRHNYWDGWSSTGALHCLKLHSQGEEDHPLGLFNGGSGNAWTDSANRYVVVGYNNFGTENANNDWMLSLSPQNDLEDEAGEDYIVEHNYFVHDGGLSLDIAWAGRRFTARSNYDETDDTTSIGISVQHDNALSPAWNTDYYPNASDVTTQAPA